MPVGAALESGSAERRFRNIASIILIHNGPSDEEAALQTLIDTKSNVGKERLRPGVWRLKSNNVTQMLLRDVRAVVGEGSLTWCTIEDQALRRWPT